MSLRAVLSALWKGRLKLDWLVVRLRCVSERSMTASEVEDEIVSELAATAA